MEPVSVNSEQDLRDKFGHKKTGITKRIWRRYVQIFRAAKVLKNVNN